MKDTPRYEFIKYLMEMKVTEALAARSQDKIRQARAEKISQWFEQFDLLLEQIFNSSEFARWHDLNGRKILSILTLDTRSRGLNIKVNGESPELLNRSVGVFFCRAQDIKGSWQSGAPIRIDGRQYTVSEAKLLQDQVWRISLEANE